MNQTIFLHFFCKRLRLCLIIGIVALNFENGNCQTNNDSTRNAGIEVGSELHDKARLLNLRQVFELIVNAEDVLNRSKQDLKRKPASLVSTANWEIEYSNKNKYDDVLLVDTGSGSLMISFSENGGNSKYMLFLPQYATMDEVVKFLKDEFQVNTDSEHFTTKSKSGKPVIVGSAEIESLKKKGLMIILYSK